MLKTTSKQYTKKSFWKNKSILITGINGFIGGTLAKRLIGLGANVIGITNKKNKNKFLSFEKISSKVKIYNVNIKNFDSVEKILNNHKFSICFHLAAQPDVNIAKTHPFETFESNIRGTYNMLEALRSHKSIKSIVVASSDKAYGEYDIKDLPYKENYDLRPLYPYDVSKASGDMIAKSYATDLFKLPVVITRFANIYGPGQLNLTALIPDCILENIGNRKFIPRGDGHNKRDFLFSEDVADLYLCLSYHLFKNKNLRGEIFNAGTGHGYKVKDIIRKICFLSNNKELYANIEKRFKNKKLTGEINHQFMSYSKLNKLFKWKPSHKIDDGLRITIEWYGKFFKKYKYDDFLT